MKKPRREPPPTKSQKPAQLPARELQRVRGGSLDDPGNYQKLAITALDDWEAPVV